MIYRLSSLALAFLLALSAAFGCGSPAFLVGLAGMVLARRRRASTRHAASVATQHPGRRAAAFNAALLVTIAVLTQGCFSSVVLRPQNVGYQVPLPTQLPDEPREQFIGRLETIMTAYDANPEAYPVNPTLAGFLGSGLATLAYVASDLGQWVSDQGPRQNNPWVPAPGLARVISSQTCSANANPGVVSPEVLPGAFRKLDVGNPPDLHYLPVWFPVEQVPSLDAPPRDVTTLIGRKCPADPNADYVCLLGRIAMQPSSSPSAPPSSPPPSADPAESTASASLDEGAPPTGVPANPAAPLIILIPGLLESSSFHHVRNVASVLFSQGFSVLMLDMRDHGVTFQTQPWVNTTLGIREGRDIVTVADEIRAADGCNQQISRIGVFGFSAGGTFALRAFIQDRLHPRRGAPKGAPTVRFDGGVLSISPVLDWSWTLDHMSDTGSDGEGALCFAADADCINSGSMAYFFMELMRMHMSTAEPPADPAKRLRGRVDPRTDYLQTRGLFRRGAPGATVFNSPELAITPAQIASDIAKATKGRPQTGEFAKVAVIVSSQDDLVVGAEASQELSDELARSAALPNSNGAPAPVAIFRPKTGGHIAFGVVSNTLARRFLRYYFTHEGDSR